MNSPQITRTAFNNPANQITRRGYDDPDLDAALARTARFIKCEERIRKDLRHLLTLPARVTITRRHRSK